MKGRRVIAASLALAAVAAVACEQALSIDGAVTVAPRDACGLPVSVGLCRDCMASKCCTQASACAGEPACAAHESCMLGCGTDYACRARCEIDTPVAFPSGVPALDTCAAQKCDVPCGLTCGVNTSYADPDGAALCQSCIAANICPQANACTTDITCQNVLNCGLACTTSDCQAACIERYDGGSFLNYQGAVVSGCLTQCEFGGIWSCIGRVSWPFAKTTTETATLTLTDSATGTPLPGVVARSCDRSDQACASPFGSGTTDAGGKVTLTLQKPQTYGFNGYFDLAPPGGLTYLLFTDAPVSEANALVSTGMLTTAGLQNLASTVGITLDPSRGHIALEVQDCVLGPGSGVAVSAKGTDAQTKLFYYGSSALDPAATVTAVTGLAFLFNVPSGIVTVETTPQKVGRVAGREVVFTRAGALSVVGVPPTP